MSGVSIGGVGIWDQLVPSSGTYDLPAVPVGGPGTSVAMSKTIALAAQIPPASAGWSVGFLKF